MAANRRSIGTTLRRSRLQVLDGRSRNGRLWCDTQRALMAALGAVSPQQEHLIAVAADQVLRITALFPRSLTGDPGAARALDEAYEALRRTLVALGVDTDRSKKPNGKMPRLSVLLGTET